MRHVYANWTAGQPAPLDKRGLSIGAILDFKLLSNSLPLTFSSIGEAAEMGEIILNMLLDEQIDRNGDDTVSEISDGFGTLEYIYGMRDHISNAGNSNDATAEIKALAQEINTNMSNSVIESGNYGTFLGNLNASNALTAKVYQNAIALLNANLTHSNDLLDSLTENINSKILPNLRFNANIFRNLVYGTEITINETFDLEGTTPSDEPVPSSTDETEVNYIVILPLFVMLGLLKRMNH